MLLSNEKAFVRNRAAAVKRDRAALEAARQRARARLRRLVGSPAGLSTAFGAGLLVGWVQAGPRGGRGESEDEAPERSAGWLSWARLATSGALLARRLDLF